MTPIALDKAVVIPSMLSPIEAVSLTMNIPMAPTLPSNILMLRACRPGNRVGGDDNRPKTKKILFELQNVLLKLYHTRVLEKREYLITGIIFLVSDWNHVVTPPLNRLNETVQRRGYNIHFYAKLTKIIPF